MSVYNSVFYNQIQFALKRQKKGGNSHIFVIDRFSISGIDVYGALTLIFAKTVFSLGGRPRITS